MKRFSLLISILCAILCWSCQSETSLPVDHASIQNNLHSRGLVTETSLPQGASALFNATGGLVLNNEVFTYNGSFWSNGTALEYTPSSPDIYLTALYPVLENQIYSTETLYSNGELEDMLIAKDTLTSSSKASLNFQHLFSLLTIHVDEKIQRTLQEIRLKTPQKVSQITPKTGDFRLADESHTTIQSYRTDGTYPFILPPMENQVLEITIRTSAEEEYAQRLEPYTFQSGYKYECHLVSADERPGIRTAEDWVDFSLLINAKTPYYDSDKTLEDFGESMDGRMTYRLLADITFTESHCKHLLPIGYYDLRAFQDVFDGGGHVITDLIIPDKSTNNNVNNSYSGLFGDIGTEGIVKNLHLNHAHTVDHPTSTRIGILSARNKGSIINCTIEYSTIHYEYNNSTGFLCGLLANGYIVNCCTANNHLESTTTCLIGGLAGDASGYMINSYTYNNVYSSTTKSYVGGLAGGSPSKLIIDNCYVYHPQETKEDNFGSAVGKAINVTTRDFLTNIKTIYKYNINNQSTFTNSKLYNSNFCIDDTPITVYLNNWMTEKGSTLYPELTFTPWRTQENGSATFQ